MYYYHSLSYKITEKNPICFIESDNGIEHDPYFCWKLNRPPSTKRSNIMFLSPLKYSVCRALFSVLTYLAREFYAKASILIDYEHYNCTLQLSCLDCLDLYGIDKELLLYVIFHTQIYDLTLQGTTHLLLQWIIHFLVNYNSAAILQNSLGKIDNGRGMQNFYSLYLRTHPLYVHNIDVSNPIKLLGTTDFSPSFGIYVVCT